MAFDKISNNPPKNYSAFSYFLLNLCFFSLLFFLVTALVFHFVSLNILGFFKERGPFLGVPRETFRSQETEAFFNI